MEKNKTDSYRKLQIETADQLSLILMLYDRAISLLEKANKEISEKKYEEKTYSLIKASDIVFELLSSLDQDKGSEIASPLSRLYSFVLREITEANNNLNIKALDNAKKTLSELRKSWEGIKANPTAEVKHADNIATEINLSG